MAYVLVRNPEWRFVVTDLNHITLTTLDGRAFQRQLAFTLNDTATQQGRVPDDSPLINLAALDGDPYLAEGNRFLIGFRREAGFTVAPWQCRSAGILLQLNDKVENDQPYCDYTAFDPWGYLDRLPCLKADGTIPGPEGLDFIDQRGNDIAIALLERLNTAGIGGHGTNVGRSFLDWGWSAQWGIEPLDWQGTLSVIQLTPRIDFTIQAGVTVGQAFRDLAATGTIDIVIRPLYDPVIRPGILGEVSIYNMAGSIKRTAIMGWDIANRSLSNMDRMEDGTQRANHVQPLRANNLAIGAVENIASETKYGEYWDTPSYPAEYAVSAVEALAQEELDTRKKRSSTFKIDLLPERAPVWAIHYNIGDQVPLIATRRLRKPVNELGRIYSVPIQVADNGIETIRQLEFSADALA